MLKKTCSHTDKLSVVKDGWVSADMGKPGLIQGENFSTPVWAFEKTIGRVIVASYFVDDGNGHWANHYGDVFGDEGYFDDNYIITHWQPIVIPHKPVC